MILVVDKELKEFDKIENSSFTELNIWERQHIQEWIRNEPEILGEELLIVSIEFDRFKESNDRLDLLAIDRQGNLVIIELKRDPHAGYADLQSIRYAAMVSSMTLDTLLPYYVYYQKKYLNKEDVDQEQSLAEIKEFVTDNDFEELSNTPRIILCSEDFSQEITTTVIWLNQNGLDISCVKIQPYLVNNQIAIVPKKIIPLEEAEQYLIEIRRKEEQEKSKKRKRPLTMNILVENGLLKAGDKIFLKSKLPDHIEYDPEDPTYKAEITGKLGQSNSVRWAKDGNEYSISKLTWNIFKHQHPEQNDPGGVNGNAHWVNENDERLWEIAQSYWLEEMKE